MKLETINHTFVNGEMTLKEYIIYLKEHYSDEAHVRFYNQDTLLQDFYKVYITD